VLANDLEHGLAVFGVPLEGTDLAGDLRAGQIGLAAHQGRDGRRVIPPGVAVVGQPAVHEQGAEVGVTQTERPEQVAVDGDFLTRVTAVAHEDFHGQGHHPAGVAERWDVEFSVFGAEFHQVQR